MCGIVGYVGPQQAAPVLVEGLTRLEYRGYDSAGIAVLNPRSTAHPSRVVRAKGRVRDLEAAKEAKYQEIRDAELDARLGKLSAEDHRVLDRQLRAEAIEILRELDELQ